MCVYPWCNWFDKPVEDVNEQEAENMNCFVVHCDECVNFCYKEVDEEGDD